jgi:hypothetical protein
MENKLVKVIPEQLDEVIKSSGLEIKEGEQIKQSFLPFLVQLSEVQEQSVKINFEHPTDIDEKIARELRLKTVKIRTGASDLKDNRKKIHLLKGNLEQASYNIIAASCKLAEETFTQVEKAREIAEAKRKAELKAQREIEAQTYSEYLPFVIDLGQLDELSYANLLTGAKLQLQAKIDAELKAEQERIAKQKAIDEENERIRIENARLQKEAEEKEKALCLLKSTKKKEAIEFMIKIGFKKTEGGYSASDYHHFVGEQHYSEFETEKEFEAFKNDLTKQKNLEIERKKQADILAKQKADAETNAKIEAEKQAKIQAEIKAKAEAERKVFEEKAAKEKAIIDAKLKAEKEAKENLEKELKAKTEAENIARMKAEKEEKDRKQAELKASKAPDKEKLTKWIDSFNKPSDISVSGEANAVKLLIDEKFEAFKIWAKAQIINL